MAAQGLGVLVAAGPPLDFSFKELKNCAEIENEEPRSVAGRAVKKNPNPQGGAAAGSAGADQVPRNPEEEGQDTGSPGNQEGNANAPAPAGGKGNQRAGNAGTNQGTTGAAPHSAPGQTKALVIQERTLAVKLNNNQIESLTDLPQALESVMYDPLGRLQWLDLSFNWLTTIDPCISRYLQLKALYLHGNRLQSLPQVMGRLSKLPNLISVTMNGNPVENNKIYRAYIIGALPSLRSLDHATIAEDELERAYAWFQGHKVRQRARQETLDQERYLASLRE